MSSIWGNNIKISIFGESHGTAIGITINGLPSGIEIDIDEVKKEMNRRKPGKSELSTIRRENDDPEIISGFFEDKTTGTPLCAIMRNTDTRSIDYSRIKNLMRPGHADYTGHIRYKGFNDYRGGGHFSGRITAPLVFCGAICKQILQRKGIQIGAHILSIKDIYDKSFSDTDYSVINFSDLADSEIPLIDSEKYQQMRQIILSAKADNDSVGGIIECIITGVPAGTGNPFFDSVESQLSHLLFSIPSVKGVEFGSGFEMTKMFGSQCADNFYYDENNQIKTKTNYNSGILGGITTGMPIIFKAAIKPTSSIFKPQNTINIKEHKNDLLTINGRHDPCIATRVVPVIEAAAAIAILDLMEE